MLMALRLRRIYEPYSDEDGFRILVERLWPRGVKKEDAHVDLWMRTIAPSNELRKWFNHEEEKWELFQQKYIGELSETHQLITLKDIISKHHSVTLLFSSKNELHNNAVVLYNLLK